LIGAGPGRTEADASVSPFTASVSYVVPVDGVTQVNLTVALNLGTVTSRGIYGQPPPAG
jgi:hypothetical protein